MNVRIGPARCTASIASTASAFADEAYAFEELVAEISSGILCAELGISSSLREDHVQYLAHWLAILKGDKKAIFAAAGHATRVSDYLFALQPDAQPRGIDSAGDPRQFTSPIIQPEGETHG